MHLSNGIVQKRDIYVHLTCKQWQAGGAKKEQILSLTLNRGHPKSIQPSYPLNPAQDETWISTLVSYKGSWRVTQCAGQAGGKYNHFSPWGGQQEQEDPSAHSGTDLPHSFEAHGADCLAIQLKIPEGRERERSSLLSCSLLRKAIYCCYWEYVFLHLTVPISKRKLLQSLLQLTHLLCFCSSVTGELTSNAFSSTPKHSPAEIKLPNFQKQCNHFQANFLLYFLHQMDNNKKAGVLKQFCSGRKLDKPGTDSLAEQNSAPVMYLSSWYPFVSSNTQGHTEQEAPPFPGWWLTVKNTYAH